MDKSWMNLSRVSNDYQNRVQTFLNFAFQNASQENMILCPCKKCSNINWHFREVIYEHLIVDGFIRGAYYQSIREHDMEGMLRDAFNMRSHGLQSFSPYFITSDDCNLGGNAFTETGRSAPDEEPNGEAAKFYKLINEMNEKLYEGSKYSKYPSAFIFFT
ncbi:hypothetical protein J1N35_019600 [Gossypium stocksii]|uniref:Transposase-associated domain-containing protein n=1 Tax=Gossypium stocksii TaxID=47602 RepID=A0A9D3VTJ9_9ROSI|nr:hypothetical protein J1N35_019600 [Gossypium stocksii]